MENASDASDQIWDCLGCCFKYVHACRNNSRRSGRRRSQKGGPGKIRLLRKIHTSLKYVRYIFIILLLIAAERAFLDGVHLPILFYTFFAEFCIQYLSGFESFNECIKQIQTSQIV